MLVKQFWCFNFTLQALSSEERKQILLKIADALEANEKIIRIENEADVTAAQEAGYEKSLVARLALKPGKARKSLLEEIIHILTNWRIYDDKLW